MDERDVFLLTRDWRDKDGHSTRITFWGAAAASPVRIVVPRGEPLFFVPREALTVTGRRESTALRTMQGRPVDVVRFESRRDALRERDRLRAQLDAVYESDVKPSDRFLMERFINAAMRVRGRAHPRDGFIEFVDPEVEALDIPPPRSLRLLSLDIETDGVDGALLSVAAATREAERVWIIGAELDERALLDSLFAWIQAADPDVIVGWSIAGFDLAFLERRCDALGIAFAIGRAGESGRVLSGVPPIARVPGRVVMDGPQTLRSATYSFESYRLEAVAQHFLGRGKKIAHGTSPVEEIRRMYREDPAALAEYNLEDCRLVLDIFDAADLMAFAIERQRLTGLPLDRAGGSVAAFDHLYLPRFHRAGYVAPDVGDGVEHARGSNPREPETSPGGTVLESVPGLHRNVALFDFRSLYPSIIRTFHIDPLALIKPGDDRILGFDGATFAREGAILPDLLGTLFEARARAQAEKRPALATAIKILMNSFYGVLGTQGCRFFDPRLAASITRRGHEIITTSRDWFMERGYRVIYGDTDSLFVLIGDQCDPDECRARGGELVDELNAWWRDLLARDYGLVSFLELRFETLFDRFLMPMLRHSARGTKKRYAGSVRTANGSTEIVIRGLEAVRTDWTPLARSFQRELVRRVLVGEPWEEYVTETRRRLLARELDDLLVYRKRLRRPLEAYAAEGAGAPIHVRAARQRRAEQSGREILYVMTREGPQPIEAQSAPLDYKHYLARQLAAAADSILPSLGTSFEKVAGRQLSLF